jgi:hypothetical protein
MKDYVDELRDQADIFIAKAKKFDKNIPNIVEVISEYKQFMKYHLKELQAKQYK